MLCTNSANDEADYRNYSNKIGGRIKQDNKMLKTRFLTLLFRRIVGRCCRKTGRGSCSALVRLWRRGAITLL